MAELFDGLCVIGDGLAASRHPGIGTDDQFAGKHLGRFHGPETGAIERPQTGVVAMFLDGVSYPVRENDGLFAPDDLVQCDELLGSDERARAIMDEHMLDVRG